MSGLRVRLDLAYDGTDFSGWAHQPGRRTVQGTVESALATVLRCPVPVTVAGRTDAGVHAIGQVAHADLPAVAPPQRFADRLRGVLPADVGLRALTPAPEGFDARFSALSRSYRYRVTDGFLDPLRRRDTLAWRRLLEAAAMHTAGQRLLGEHDFAAYCRAREGSTTLRRLLRLDVTREPDGVIALTAEADAFCHSMVRALVGALLVVGDGHQPVNWPAAVLAHGRRDPAVTVAPAHGLTLVEVGYPPDEELAARARATRVRRTPA